MGIPADPLASGITVTIKYGKGYEQPWAVFHGTTEQVREDIATFFGMQPDDVAGLTLSDLVANATTAAQAVGALTSGLGATVVESRNSPPVQTRPAASRPPATDRSSAWEQATAERPQAEPAANPLLALIAQAPDVRSLERLWAENQDAFADPAVTAAWKVRGRSLTRAG
ncbi:hypothetical protein [Actinoplanes sp. NPDC049265]|uniref:hypothetical protein n=1 Tax=Actinoplanes sp. NPDC049265 TaxID=3363902 RepID=UPI003712E4B3